MAVLSRGSGNLGFSCTVPVPAYRVVVMSVAWDQGPVFRKCRQLFGPGDQFYVFGVCFQNQSINDFKNDKMKLSVNEAKLTGW